MADELERRLQALMSQEYVPSPIHIPDSNDLQERLYRMEHRHRPLNLSDYPLLRNRMIHKNMGNIPIVPETYNVADPVDELRNMASSRIQRHNRHKLTQKRRLNKAKHRLSIAKIPELDIDVKRLLGERYIKKGGASASDETKRNAVTKLQSRYRGNRGRKLSKKKRHSDASSELSNEQEQFDEFLSGISKKSVSKKYIEANEWMIPSYLTRSQDSKKIKYKKFESLLKKNNVPINLSLIHI